MPRAHTISTAAHVASPVVDMIRPRHITSFRNHFDSSATGRLPRRRSPLQAVFSRGRLPRRVEPPQAIQQDVTLLADMVHGMVLQSERLTACVYVSVSVHVFVCFSVCSKCLIWLKTRCLYS